MEYKFANRLSHLKASPLRENAKKNMLDPEVISFAYGFPPQEAFPIEKMAAISTELYAMDNPEPFLQYGPSEGIPLLRNALKQRLHEVVGIPDTNEDELIIVSGSSQAMDLAVKTFCNEGDTVLFEEQTFSGAVNTVRSYGAVPVGLPMKGESIDISAVKKALEEDSEKKIKMIYLIPTFQNPLGTSMPLEKRQEIYDIAKEHEVIIYEDDPYGDLLYEGEEIPKIKAFDTEGLVIYAGSFSKIFAPSSRIGFVLAPADITKKLILGKQVTDSHTNQYWQLIAAKLMLEYDFEAHVEELRDLYREKFLLMIESLDKYTRPFLDYVRPTGGYFLCCKMSDKVDAEKFNDYLIDHRVAIIPGNVMSVNGEGYEKYFRLNFTKPTLAEIEKGISILGEALRYASSEPLVKTF